MIHYEDTKAQGMSMSALTYGLVIGVLLIIINLVFYFFGQYTSKALNYLSYALILTGIVFSTKAWRDNIRGGYITYGQALGFGTLIILIASTFLAIFTYVYYKFIDPGALNELLLAGEQSMIESNSYITDEQLDQALAMSEIFMKPGLIAISTFFSYTFLGFVISLITSIFMKKTRPDEF